METEVVGSANTLVFLGYTFGTFVIVIQSGAILFGYLLGSVPFGMLLTKMFGYGDIRSIGSGNIGATNVLRTGNKALGLATLLLDSSKGAIAVLVASSVNPIFLKEIFLITVGLAAILGHCFPVWLKFKGGKGVATTLGTLLAAVPFAGLAACAAWLLTAFIFRISSLAALVAMLVAPAATYFVYSPTAAAINLAITSLVWFRHKDNIKRLLKGEEPRIGKKKKDEHANAEPAEKTE